MKTASPSARSLPGLLKPATSSSIEVLESRIAPSIFIVTSLADSGAGTLRAALALADSHPGPDTILFHLPAPPTHSENIITLTGGPLTSLGNVTIKGPGAGKLIINGAGLYQGFNINDNVSATDSPVTISGLSIVHGYSGSGGSGIYSTESLTLKNVTISGGTSTSSPAGAFAVDVHGDTTAGTKVSISNSLISGNTGAGGGGVGLYGLKSFALTNTAIIGNAVPDGGGGGMYASVNASGTGGTITGCLISGNSAYFAAGLHLADNNPAKTSKITISGTKITGNVSNAVGFDGAGIDGGGVLISSGNAVIAGSAIDNNTAAYYGGGIAVSGITSLTISKSSITGNKATMSNSSSPEPGGGGLFIMGNGSATLVPVTITGSNISDNSSINGGGILAEDGVSLSIAGSKIAGNAASGIVTTGNGLDKVNLSITASTLSGNTAGAGGAIYSGDGNLTGAGGVFTMTNSKVTGNVAAGDGGGGLFLNGKSSVIIKNSTFSNNSADYGGGLHIGFTTTFELIGGKITGNSVQSVGGGISVLSSTGSILGVTISGNVALAEAGGVYSDNNTAGAVTLQIAKVFANSAPIGPDVDDNPGDLSTFTFV